jgi:hypothetical protein
MDKQDNVRMMMPLTCRCNTCGQYAGIGTKYNMRKETVLNERYLGIAIFRFYFKCNDCYSEITFKTDPKNSDYIVEHGATRSYDAYRDMLAAESALKQLREQDEEGDSMRFLENRTADSKREIDINDALEEIRINSRKRGLITADQMLQQIFNYQAQHDMELNEDEDKELQEAKEKIKIKRLRDDDQEEALLKDSHIFDVFSAAAVAKKGHALDGTDKSQASASTASLGKKPHLHAVAKKRVLEQDGESSGNGNSTQNGNLLAKVEQKMLQKSAASAAVQQPAEKKKNTALCNYSDSD